MNPEIKALIEKAKRSQKAASNLFKDGDSDFAASRAYYSLFYTASALSLSRELSFSSHSGVIANFGKEFAGTGALNPKYHNYRVPHACVTKPEFKYLLVISANKFSKLCNKRYLIESQDRRNIGDYSIVVEVTEEFIQAAENYLKRAS